MLLKKHATARAAPPAAADVTATPSGVLPVSLACAVILLATERPSTRPCRHTALLGATPSDGAVSPASADGYCHLCRCHT